MSEDLTHYGVLGMRWGVRNSGSSGRVARAGRLAKKADRNERLATSASKMNTENGARAAKRYAKISKRARNKSEQLVPTKYTADKLSKSASGLERKATDIRGSKNIATRIIAAPIARRYEEKAAKKRDAAIEIMKTVTFERPFNPRTQADRADRFKSQVSERSGEPYSSRSSGGKRSGKGKELAWGVAAVVASGLAKPTAQRFGESLAIYTGEKVAASSIGAKLGTAAAKNLARGFAKP